MFKRLKGSGAGQTMTEYILIIALIAIVAIVAIKLFGKTVKGGYDTATQQVKENTGQK